STLQLSSLAGLQLMLTIQNLPYLAPYLISLVISLAVMVYVWRHRGSGELAWYAVYAGAQALWTFGYIFELLGPDLPEKIFWDNFQWFGSTMVPAAALLFALEYTGRKGRFLDHLKIAFFAI